MISVRGAALDLQEGREDFPIKRKADVLFMEKPRSLLQTCAKSVSLEGSENFRQLCSRIWNKKLIPKLQFVAQKECPIKPLDKWLIVKLMIIDRSYKLSLN